MVALSSGAGAQTIDLASGGADPIWRGVSAGARAGASLDEGAVNAGDARRDLIIGAPGGPGITGAVYIVFGGPIRTGDLLLSAANTTIRGGAANDLFGTATAAGNILNVAGTTPRALVVGAPGATGGRGSVYLFRGGFTNGNSLTTADAVLTVLGAAGDNLGAAIATADLNNDGYREIVIGAPGTGRIYIIAGSATLAGTIDLATTAPTITIAAAGLGGTFAAGDVTGDGVTDLLAGHAAAGAVHVMRGRNGSMPPATFDMTFGGIDANDGVGGSVRLADVDADGISDVLIGARGGDGPNNVRPEAGEVYLLYGGPALSGRTLAVADVTFYGGEAGGRVGTLLASGDINRDIPNDLVFGSPTARGGNGRLDVYYGRSRRTTGTLRPDGTRVVDFATDEVSRTILGDTAGGTITAVQVFEVTGEGARDVIVGMSGSQSGVGAVYFTISPRLTLGATSVTLNGFQGIVSSSPVPVRNISVIPITWRTSSNRPWLSATAEGSTSATAFGDVVITANGNGLPPGTHTGVITVSSTSSHLTMAQPLNVTFVVHETQPSPGTPPASGMPPGARYNLLWRHSTEGWLAVWNMNGVTMTSAGSISINRMTDANWRIAGYGDLNGDGSKDIVWQHEADGWLAAWMLRGTQVIATPMLSISKAAAGWKVRAVGDINGDGRADLIWRQADGSLAAWTMNGAQVIGTAYLSINRLADPNWEIVAAGDLSGDGKADIVWQNKVEGWLGTWLLDGFRVTSTRILSINKMTDTSWTIRGAQDVNGDGFADLLWQHDAGYLATWYMRTETVAATLMLNPDRVASAAWRVAGPK